ncbi:hypothetical protein TEA_027631 [Camellia sinensis var. sinensis]|uniref:Uncharacterized protein n=1 Tax=Camellia sinensis var. sinensis TaxID=542762 RepID=A0A4S4DLW7_CAMSN|nr:hypothetical protein TEA_027631 [Camellia sinensis var. sinensis]
MIQSRTRHCELSPAPSRTNDHRTETAPCPILMTTVQQQHHHCEGSTVLVRGKSYPITIPMTTGQHHRCNGFTVVRKCKSKRVRKSSCPLPHKQTTINSYPVVRKCKSKRVRKSSCPLPHKQTTINSYPSRQKLLALKKSSSANQLGKNNIKIPVN